MAKFPKATIDLTGVTIEQIMNLDIDINKLSRGDLSRVVGRLISASNKRIRRLAKTEIGRLSPAYISRMERGGQFSTKPIHKLPKQQQTNALRNLFAETKGFLELKTSFASGWKRVRKEIAASIGIPKDFLNTETKSKRFWKTYRELVDGKNIPDKNTKSRYNSERIQELLAQKFSGKGGFGQKRKPIINELNVRINELYEEEKRINKIQNDINEQFDEEDGYDIYD